MLVLNRRWDLQICLDILSHWLDLMNIDGWIPREQILGAEALRWVLLLLNGILYFPCEVHYFIYFYHFSGSKVPEEFVPQHPSNGNPPTLFLILNGKPFFYFENVLWQFSIHYIFIVTVILSFYCVVGSK